MATTRAERPSYDPTLVPLWADPDTGSVRCREHGDRRVHTVQMPRRLSSDGLTFCELCPRKRGRPSLKVVK